MNSSEYIWEFPNWPDWHYSSDALVQPLADVHRARGYLLGRMQAIGMGLQDQARLQALTKDVLKTSEIEGQHLNQSSVRSSVARRLGVDTGALAPADRHVDGVVEMILDAIGHHAQPLTAKRLFSWHAALFPTGYSGLSPIRVGAWRDDALGPMQIVSGPIGREKVHYQAPPASQVAAEMAVFLDWFNQASSQDVVIKAGIAHLWFVTVHPFDDGNGRIARAVGDMALARADHSVQRFYSLSAQIQQERDTYYNLLERTQRGTLNITDWLTWFLDCLLRALESADDTLSTVLHSAHFWQHWADTSLNPRQLKVLKRLLDGIEGKLTNRKWAKIAKCSADTALRDITALLKLGVLRKTNAGGRSTSYEIASV